jgi:hypothetical protein
MVAFVPGFITCNDSNFGTVVDLAGKRNLLLYFLIYTIHLFSTY